MKISVSENEILLTPETDRESDFVNANPEIGKNLKKDWGIPVDDKTMQLVNMSFTNQFVAWEDLENKRAKKQSESEPATSKLLHFRDGQLIEEDEIPPPPAGSAPNTRAPYPFPQTLVSSAHRRQPVRPPCG